MLFFLSVTDLSNTVLYSSLYVRLFFSSGLGCEIGMQFSVLSAVRTRFHRFIVCVELFDLFPSLAMCTLHLSSTKISVYQTSVQSSCSVKTCNMSTGLPGYFKKYFKCLFSMYVNTKLSVMYFTNEHRNCNQNKKNF